jgi:hypothetical protein
MRLSAGEGTLKIAAAIGAENLLGIEPGIAAGLAPEPGDGEWCR